MRRYFWFCIILYHITTTCMDQTPTLLQICLNHFSEKILPSYTNPQQLLDLKNKLPSYLYEKIITHFVKMNKWKNPYIFTTNTIKNENSITHKSDLYTLNDQLITLFIKYIDQEDPENQGLREQIKKRFIAQNSPNNKYTIVYQIEDGQFFIFDKQNNTYLGKLFTQKTYVTKSLFTANSKYFIALVNDMLCIWDLSKISNQPLVPIHTYEVKTSTQIYQNKNKLLFYFDDILYVWDFCNLKEPQKILKLKGINLVGKINSSILYVNTEKKSVLIYSGTMDQPNLNPTKEKSFFICSGTAEQNILNTILDKNPKSIIPKKIIIDKKQDTKESISKKIDRAINQQLANLDSESLV